MRTAKWLLLPVVLFGLVILSGTDAPPAATDINPTWSPPDAAPEANTPLEALVKGSNQFACDLYARLRVKEGNLLLSPYSIATLCSMTHAGARGRTAEQIAQVLHNTLTAAEVAEASRELVSRITGQKADAAQRKGIELTTANSLWVHQGYPVKPEFVNLLKANWKADVGQVDFFGATEAARTKINAWVARETRNMISEIFPRGALDGTTRLALVNAVYFKGIWQTKFKKGDTSDRPFTPPGGQAVEVPMMHQDSVYSYIDEKDFHGVILPYGSGDMAMVVLLPRAVDGLGKLEEALSAEKLDQWCSQAHGSEVDLYLPKFTFSSGFSLPKELQALGMTDAFEGGKADFSGMTGDKSLFLSVVEHRAIIEVDEEGTRAAAATGGGFGCSAKGPSVIFRADHPFLFLIRDTRTHAILFMGRVTNPKG